MALNRLCCALSLALILLCACEDKSIEAPPETNSYLFSFENDLMAWETRGLDLELGDSLIAWSIERTQEFAKEGSTSLKFYLENYNDAGKIWIERSFGVQPNCSYHVKVAYAFASADFGMANLWTLITGVVPQSPGTRDDLIYQGHTGNGSQEDVGYLWLDKSYSFNAISNTAGQLYVLVGIWGTWETPRTYYLDSLSIVISQSEHQ